MAYHDMLPGTTNLQQLGRGLDKCGFSSRADPEGADQLGKGAFELCVTRISLRP